VSHRGTVLLVDDDADIRESLSLVLEDLGFRAVTARNGAEGLALARELQPPPKLILLDLMMPEVDGWQFLTQREQAAAVAGIPVVVMTAVKHAPLEPGQVRAVLIKPITFEQLEAVLGVEPVGAVRAAARGRVGEPID
jgi:CheY-like chemotaxis protein